MIASPAAINSISAASNAIVPQKNNLEKPQADGFSSMVSNALQDVSTQQASATSAEENYSAGVPGATLAKALVASDKATVAWSATVAVRNEIVSAYQTIMNMQF